MDKIKKVVKHATIIKEETDYNELVTLIEVYIPTIIIKEVLE